MNDPPCLPTDSLRCSESDSQQYSAGPQTTSLLPIVSSVSGSRRCDVEHHITAELRSRAPALLGGAPRNLGGRIELGAMDDDPTQAGGCAQALQRRGIGQTT